MSNIVRVSALDDDTIDIELSNGNLILLDMKSLMATPEFAMLREDNRLLYPKTDGCSVFWKDGPRISLDEAIGLLKK
ncbi:hypothetical protein LJC56_08325 [Christensenellaceae bacterium OttesenSCG-928-K19]|nr:hypothetical protein [Christensenellaceae bacterium OttesenSCG-928-K19]